jgi:hypothetical protein
MTPLEKAKELLNKYYDIDRGLAKSFGEFERVFKRARKCALLAVDEILNEYPPECPEESYEKERYLFWQQVKQEIENYEGDS